MMLNIGISAKVQYPFPEPLPLVAGGVLLVATLWYIQNR